MKKLIIIFIATILSWHTSVAQSITLKECLEQTRKNFPTLQQKDILKATNKELQKAIWYSYVPQISLDGSASYQSHVAGMEIEMPYIEVMPGMPPIQPDPLDLPKIPKFQYNAYVQATQLIWDGGAVKALGNELQAGTDAQLAQTDVEMRKVEESVLELYFSLLMMDAQIKLQDTLLEEIERQKNKVENALSNGVATQNDLDEVTVELLKAEQNSNQLSTSRESIIQALAIFTGMELSKETIAQRPDFPLASASTEQKRVAPLRPEHAQLDAEKRKADASLEAFLAEGMPKMALFARVGYGRPGLNMLDPEPSSFFAYGVKLNWNFGRLYGLKAQKKQSEGTKQLVELKREALEKEIKSTLSKHNSDYIQYEDLMMQDDEIITLKKRIAERAKLQEAEGQLSTTEYLKKITALNAAIQTKDLHSLLLLKSQYKTLHTYGVQIDK